MEVPFLKINCEHRRVYSINLSQQSLTPPPVAAAALSFLPPSLPFPSSRPPTTLHAMFGMREAYGLITLLAILGAGWFLYDLLRAEPGGDRLTVVLLFEDAEGIYAGTPVKTRGVTVGEVHRVTLAPGGRGTEVLCSLSRSPGAAPRVGSRFWIVRPWFGGLAAGGGGLDTLIKDSYVAYEVGEASAPPLADASRVPGMRLPPDNPRALLDLPPAPGDIEFSVRFATNHGLTPAAPVRHRGIAVGLVTSIELLPDGNGVEVRARVDRRHRPLLHTETVFWIDGVDIRAGWRGVSVEGLEAILEGASLAFYTPEDRARTPAPDNAIFAGAAVRPEITWRPPATLPTSSSPPVRLDGDDPMLASLVSVHYSCVEEDLFSADDRYERTTPGVLHRTLDGLPAVLVLARGVDGRLWIDDGGGEPEVVDESITVEHADGSVLEAGVAWRAEGENDLALLRLPPAGSKTPRAEIRILEPSERSGAIDVYVPIEDGGWQRITGTLDGEGKVSGIAAETPDAIIVRDGSPIGVWRAREEKTDGAAFLFDVLPPPLRREGTGGEGSAPRSSGG